MSPLPFADAVIVAAGSSRRMGGLDKLQVDLGGQPLLAWSVAAMRAAASVRDVLVVTGPDRVDELAATPWLRSIGARVIAGGDRRQDSVAAGVREATAEVVLVHDGARPLVSPGLIDAVATTAAKAGAAIPVLAVADSLKRVEGGVIVGGSPRDGIGRAQTPQGARRALLLAAVDAYADGPEVFGDEAELLGRAGTPVQAVDGDARNLKVTLPADLEMARLLTGVRVPAPRYATGSDSHPFGPDDGLRLGGIEVLDAPRLWGHSDGDAALHAICDALLAAAGLGDLGRLFPAGDPATRGIDSRELMTSVVGRLEAAGFVAASVDLTITAARPRLGGARLDRMREVIAGLAHLPAGSVSVKAATGNLAGSDGAGVTISATALAAVVAR
jgi:2-C-methyl-D-erythritol 4-phosphate cytidylyltransferase / 2-C-methyl-D-erythritol 2,4-cyclodiphosphate synthase